MKNEEIYIKEALERCKGIVSKAAEELGISERTLFRKMAKYNLNEYRKEVKAVHVELNKSAKTKEQLKEEIAALQAQLEKIEQEESKYLDLSANPAWRLGDPWNDCELLEVGIEIRKEQEYKNKGFYLNSIFNWEIITDSDNQLVLLPTKK